MSTGKAAVGLDDLVDRVERVLEEVQSGLLERARQMLAERTVDVDSYADLAERAAANAGWSMVALVRVGGVRSKNQVRDEGNHSMCAAGSDSRERRVCGVRSGKCGEGRGGEGLLEGTYLQHPVYVAKSDGECRPRLTAQNIGGNTTAWPPLNRTTVLPTRRRALAVGCDGEGALAGDGSEMTVVEGKNALANALRAGDDGGVGIPQWKIGVSLHQVTNAW